MYGYTQPCLIETPKSGGRGNRCAAFSIDEPSSYNTVGFVPKQICSL
jgi:hypothetical protein